MSMEASPWHAAFPSPGNTTPKSISRSELLHCLQAGQRPGKDFLLVDLRRADFEVGFPPFLFPSSLSQVGTELILECSGRDCHGRDQPPGTELVPIA
jgi:hypothetical protein